MGARNSKPQTVELPNITPFKITPEVVARIEEASNRRRSTTGTSFVCDSCSSHETAQSNQTMSSSSGNPNALLQQIAWEQKKSAEAEEAQFGKTLERINKMFGNPVNWAKECSGDIEDLKQRLLLCYKEYHNEPLRCSDHAQEYYNFIFSKHFETILKEKTIKSENDADIKESSRDKI